MSCTPWKPALWQVGELRRSKIGHLPRLETAAFDNRRAALIDRVENRFFVCALKSKDIAAFATLPL
jgi:hypothetical protein